jgi:hypothetical protein
MTAHAPQRGDAYQPKVQPWGRGPDATIVLKERGISANGGQVSDSSLCGVPSERIPISEDTPSQGGALRWYASPRWGGKKGAVCDCLKTEVRTAELRILKSIASEGWHQ